MAGYISIYKTFATPTTHMRVRPIIMSFDMFKVGSVFEGRVIPIKLLHPSRKNNQAAINVSCTKSTDLWIAGYPSRIVRMLHLKCPTYTGSKRICGENVN